MSASESQRLKELYEFGPFRVDPEKEVLLRAGEPVPLTPKAFQILLVLVRHNQQIVTKDDLMKSVWPDTFVEEANLSRNVFMLRKALGESPQDHQYILTVPGRGYRLTESVRLVPGQEVSIVAANHSKVQVQVKETGLGLWIAIGVVCAIAAVVGWRSFQDRPQVAHTRIMLAVLPFENLTGDPEQEYFADGLTEELISQLGRLSARHLGVIARTSVMGYKHSDKRLDQIGRELGVQYVLEGSVRRATDRYRVTAQLISVTDQTHLWAGDFDRELQDVLALQDDVSLAVARETRLKLEPAVQTELGRSRQVNGEAYEAYLKGRYFWNKRTEQGFRRAVEYFELSIAKDPAYAQAYAGLADTYLLLGGYGFEPQKENMAKAKAAALKAIAIDDSLAEAYTTLGLIHEQDWNWGESEKNFKRAIALNPNYAVAHHWYGSGYLAGVGKTDEAIAQLRTAHELDPLSLMISVDLAHWLCSTGNYDEGMVHFRKVLDIDPDFAQAHYYLSRAYDQKGSYAEAIAEAEKIKPLGTPYTLEQLGRVYAVQGKRREALAMVQKLQQVSKHSYVDPAIVARVYLALGDKDAAFVWLKKAYEQRTTAMDGLKCERFYDPIRSDPRFVDLVRRVGIP